MMTKTTLLEMHLFSRNFDCSLKVYNDGSI
jgi:hypothetical protein